MKKYNKSVMGVKTTTIVMEDQAVIVGADSAYGLAFCSAKADSAIANILRSICDATDKLMEFDNMEEPFVTLYLDRYEGSYVEAACHFAEKLEEELFRVEGSE